MNLAKLSKFPEPVDVVPSRLKSLRSILKVPGVVLLIVAKVYPSMILISLGIGPTIP